MEGLGEKDCAIIIKEDCSVEVILPSPKDEDGDELAPANAFMTITLVTALSHTDLLEELYKRMDKELEELKDD